MTTPVTPWASRLVGSRRLLAAGVVAAVATVSTSFYLARDDGHPMFEVAEAGATVRIGSGSFHLDSVRDVGIVTDGYDARQPVAGATYVVAAVSVSGLARGEGCLVHLKAGDYWFVDDSSYQPAEPATTSCLELDGADGTVEWAFEVPERLVGQVDGVVVNTGTDTERFTVVLPGTLG